MDSKKANGNAGEGSQQRSQTSTWTYAIENIGDLFDDDTRPFQLPTVSVNPSVPEPTETSRPIGGTPADYLAASGRQAKGTTKPEEADPGQTSDASPVTGSVPVPASVESPAPQVAAAQETPQPVPVTQDTPPLPQPATLPVSPQAMRPASGSPAPVASGPATSPQPLYSQPSMRGKGPVPQGDAMAAQLQRPEYKEAAQAEPEPKPEAKGKVTSVLAVLLLLAAAAVAVLPLSQVATDGKAAPAAVNLICALPVVGLLAWLAVVIGARSVGQPKGTPGRGRGTAAVVAAPLAPVVAAVLLVVAVLGVARSIVADGNLSKIQQDGGLTIVYPSGRFDIDKGVADVATKMGLLPENTLNADSSIPLSTSNDSIYMGTTAIDLSAVQGNDAPKITEDQLVALATAVEQLEQNGYSVALGPDEKSATITDARGEKLTVTLNSTSRRSKVSGQAQEGDDAASAAEPAAEGEGAGQAAGEEGQPATEATSSVAGEEAYGEGLAEEDSTSFRTAAQQ